MRGLLDGVISAVRALLRSPLRASLTVLGILIGVAAVITVTALGSGARDNVSKQIQAIGSNFVIIFPQASQASGAHGAQGSGVRLTEDDGRAILNESTSIVAVAPAASLTCTVKLDVPAVVGVPESTPAAVSVNPAGNVPLASDHVYPGVPPLAANV